MRKITIILFLLPFFGFAQFELDLTAINLEDNSKISNVQIRLGKYQMITPLNGKCGLYPIDINALNDTLFIQHSNFKFDILPLYEHHYDIVENVLIIDLYGQPWKKNQINIDLNIATSKKVKNDTVKIDWSLPGSNALVSFKPTNEIKKKRKNNTKSTGPFVHAYDDLANGEFIITTDNTVRKIPFLKENWMQIVCYDIPKAEQRNQKELELLTLYFKEIQASEHRKLWASVIHTRETDSLQLEIVRLESEIDRLNGIPVPPEKNLPYPPPPKPENEEEPYVVIHYEAHPYIGEKEFIAHLTNVLSNRVSDYSGNITLEVIVKKDGNVRTNVLHASEDKMEITNVLRHYIKNCHWKTAMCNGRRLESSVILNISVQKN